MGAHGVGAGVHHRGVAHGALLAMISSAKGQTLTTHGGFSHTRKPAYCPLRGGDGADVIFTRIPGWCTARMTGLLADRKLAVVCGREQTVHQSAPVFVCRYPDTPGERCEHMRPDVATTHLARTRVIDQSGTQHLSSRQDVCVPGQAGAASNGSSQC